MEAAQRLVVVDPWFNGGLFTDGRVVAARLVRLTAVLNDTELFRAIRSAVLLTAGGRGTPGVLVVVVACHNKVGRCVLYVPNPVGVLRAQVLEVRREVVIPECKLFIISFSSKTSRVEP